jgi:phosphopantothenoylcysteine synthetase/decarboxylase
MICLIRRTITVTICESLSVVWSPSGQSALTGSERETIVIITKSVTKFSTNRTTSVFSDSPCSEDKGEMP